jgi:hypothetical protein
MRYVFKDGRRVHPYGQFSGGQVQLAKADIVTARRLPGKGRERESDFEHLANSAPGAIAVVVSCWGMPGFGSELGRLSAGVPASAN